MKKGAKKTNKIPKEQLNSDSQNQNKSINKKNNSNDIKNNKIINSIIPLQNLKGTNTCYINVIVQILYHSPFFKQELEKIIFGNKENDKLNPLYQLKQLFLNYQKYQTEEKNEKAILNVQNLRYTLSKLFPDVIPNQSGDPIEILNYLFNICHLFLIKGKKLNDQNSSSYNCDNKCISHKLFPLKIKENLTCSKCQKMKTIKYDNNYFIYEIFVFEILNYCEKLECKDFRNKLFDFSKSINSKVDNYIKINKCECKKSQINKELIQYEQINSNFIINLTWDSPIPLLTDICKIYTLIPQITSNSNIFKVDKKLTKNYYLYGLILYYNNHYINAIYIFNENSWYFCDDLNYKKFNSYKELIDYLILNHISPVILFYSIQPYDNEIDKEEVYHTNVYNEQYNKCLEIDKRNGNNPSSNFNICDSNLANSVLINNKFTALENYKRNLNSNSKSLILGSINDNINVSQLWYCPNCKTKNNTTNNKCRICNIEYEFNIIEVENEQLPETIYSKDFFKLRAGDKKNKNNNNKKSNLLNNNIINGQEMKFFKEQQNQYKKNDKRVKVGDIYLGSIINEEKEYNSIKLRNGYMK